MTTVCLGACVSTVISVPGPKPFVGGVVFENRTPDALEDVRLRVVAASGFVACSYIIANTDCVTTFPLQQYQANQLTVSWSRAGRSEDSGAFVIPLPKPLPRNRPLTAVIRIDGSNGFSAVFRPLYGL